MSAQVENFANQAVYVLQMNSAEAIRYIARNGQCSTEMAEKAFRTVVTFHKQK